MILLFTILLYTIVSVMIKLKNLINLSAKEHNDRHPIWWTRFWMESHNCIYWLLFILEFSIFSLWMSFYLKKSPAFDSDKIMSIHLNFNLKKKNLFFVTVRFTPLHIYSIFCIIVANQNAFSFFTLL